jgi:hypothetical protein
MCCPIMIMINIFGGSVRFLNSANNNSKQYMTHAIKQVINKNSDHCKQPICFLTSFSLINFFIFYPNLFFKPSYFYFLTLFIEIS